MDIVYIVTREAFGRSNSREIVSVHLSKDTADAMRDLYINNGKTSVASTWQWLVEPFEVQP